MKKTSMISALIAASTVFGGNLVSAQDRALLKHHERFKQRLNPPQTQRSIPAPMPYYETSPGSLEGSAGQPTPPSSMSPSQPPAAIISPGDAGSTQGAQPTPPTPDLTNVPEERFTSNNAIDTRGLLADRTSGSPLSGPLNTIGDFFAPGGSGLNAPLTTSSSIFFANNGSSVFFDPNSTYRADFSGAILVDNIQLVEERTNPFVARVVQPTDYEAVASQGLRSILGDGDIVLGQIDIIPQPSLDPNGNPNGPPLSDVISQSFSHTRASSVGLLVSAPGAQLGRMKLTEQNSPMPRDRIFFDYSFFHNAQVASTRPGVHRFAPGFEKTFFDDICSVEVRVPLGVTLNSAQTLGTIDSNSTELGNLGFAFKTLLLDRGNFLLTAGLGVQTPTANDNVVSRLDGSEAIRVVNNQVRLLPYIATLHTSGDWMWQNWVQVDAAASGNDVRFNGQHAGILQEQNFIYLDSSLSRWMYRDYELGTGWALTGEVHYNRTLGDADFIQMNGFTAGTPGFEADIVNLTFGSTYVYGKTTFTTAYGTPITRDRGFDGEFRLLVNRFF